MQSLKIPGMREQAFRLVFLQGIVVLILTVCFLIFDNKFVAVDLFLGGLTWILPASIVTYFVFSNVSVKAAGVFVVKCYVGEFFKLLISALIFILLLKFGKVSLLPALVGYAGALWSIFLLPILMLRNK